MADEDVAEPHLPQGRDGRVDPVRRAVAADDQVEVRLQPKPGAEIQDLATLAGEFANELLNQVVRARVGESTAQLREYYMAKAFFANANQTSIDALLAEHAGVREAVLYPSLEMTHDQLLAVVGRLRRTADGPRYPEVRVVVP